MKKILSLLTIIAFFAVSAEQAEAKNYGFNSKGIVIESQKTKKQNVPLVKIHENVLLELPQAAELYIQNIPNQKNNSSYSAQHTVYLY